MNEETKKHSGHRMPGRPKRSGRQGQAGTEKQILHHAGLLFLKSGYAAVSISMITRAVGITKPTLYHYFPDKEHLYAAVIRDQLERAGKQIRREISKEGSVRQRLFGLACGFFRFAPMSVGHMMRDVSLQLGSELVRGVMETYDREIVEPHRRLFLEGMRRGELEEHPERVPVLADIWLGMLDWQSSRMFRVREDDRKLAETTDVLVSTFMDGVANKRRESCTTIM